MEFGFSMPTRGPLSSPDSLATLAHRGEELGFGFLSVSDHVVIPKTIQSRYPYTESGKFMASGECLEQLALLSFVAAQTSAARLLTSVMVLPHRAPILAAKMLATIDVLSGGRLTVACGVGWMREEFEVIGAPPYDERGAVGDEYIRAFKELWTSDNPTFEGRYVSFSDISFEPKPVQRPHPPVWVGGESPPALRRAAVLGDGWYPIGNNPRFPVGTVEQLAQALGSIRRHAEDAGRDPSAIDVAYSAGWYDDRQAQTLSSGERRTFTGTPEQVSGDIHAFEQQGVRHLMLGMQARTLPETLERMERFASEVMPLVRG